MILAVFFYTLQSLQYTQHGDGVARPRGVVQCPPLALARTVKHSSASTDRSRSQNPPQTALPTGMTYLPVSAFVRFLSHDTEHTPDDTVMLQQ